MDSVDSLDSVRTDEGRLTGSLEVSGLWILGLNIRILILMQI